MILTGPMHNAPIVPLQFVYRAGSIHISFIFFIVIECLVSGLC